MTGNSMGKHFLDLPYEIVFEIFRGLSKGKLIEISKLSVKLKDIAGDKRFWKDVCIKYEPNTKLKNPIFAFEELYSESWPVKTIDLTNTKIKTPVSLKTDQSVKVTKLIVSSVEANKVTIEAVLAKYQCTELFLDLQLIDCYGHVMGVAPAAFSKQSALEVLSLRTQKYTHTKIEAESMSLLKFHHWLAQVLSYCKNLKSLDLNRMHLTNSQLTDFVKILPTSLEKLLLLKSVPNPKDSFFEVLAESCPNLRELELCPSSVKCPSLLKFQFLETLSVFPCGCRGISDWHMYLLKFPALKAVHIDIRSSSDLAKDFFLTVFSETISVEMLRSMLEPHGVITQLIESSVPSPVDDNLWEVSKAV